MPFIVPAPPPPATPSVVSTLGERAWGYLPGYVRSSDDGTVRALLDAVGAPVQGSVDVITRPDVMTDPAAAPFDQLPRLAALVGVDLTGIPDDLTRDWIADPLSGWDGSLDAVAHRVRLMLTGTKSVTITCPYLGDAWRVLVQTVFTESAGLDVEKVRAAVPAWLRLTILSV